MNTIGHRTTSGGILGIHALTSLHAGTGTALGTVDLPVQRERQNGWPNIAGSALKGILRDACRESLVAAGGATNREQADRDPTIGSLFGASKKQAEQENAGAISVTDARIIAFPIRSLQGGFAWVTCPAALGRLERDLTLVGQKTNQLRTDNSINDFHAIVTPDSPLVIKNSFLQLDDETFHVAGGDCTAIARWLSNHLISETEEFDGTRERFCKHLAVVSDSDFTHIVKYATEVTARIGLDYETKTVKNGALFYQEFVPTEALFYSIVLLNESRSTGKKATAAEMLSTLRQTIDATGVLQIGGDETTGKGFCATRLWIGENAK